MRLKLIIILSFLSVSSVFAQSDSVKVDQNKNKIGELNQRLDNLLESSKTIDGDSVQYKLDLLFKEIKGIKTSLTELKESVEELNETKAIQVAEEKIADIESGKYYMVLASRRDLGRINRAKKAMDSRDLMVVQNSKETWYHLVSTRAMSMSDAILKTAAERKNGVQDAWWVTAKKLKVN